MKVWNTIKEWFRDDSFLLSCIVVIIILTTFICFGIWKEYMVRESITNYSYIIWQDEGQSKMNALREKMAEEINKYIQEVAPSSSLRGLHLLDDCHEADIDIVFVLAQGQIESHYGTTGLARKTNSVFNVYAYDGTEFEEIHEKGKFSHPNKSVKPYLDLLSRRYLSSNVSEYDLMLNFVDKDGNRYASDPNYEKKLLATYEKILKTTKIDSLQREYNKIKLVSGL